MADPGLGSPVAAGAAVPDSFGNVTAEYLALRRECGLVQGRWEVVWVEGPDAVSFLQGLVSADMEELAEWGVCRSFLLTPRGMVRFSLWVLKEGDKLGLVCSRGEGPDLSETLDYYRIRIKAKVSVDPRPVSALVGPTVPWTETLEQGRWEPNAENFRAPAPLAGVPRVFFTGEAPEGIRPVGELAWRAVRVESGEPDVALDLDERTIPQETGELADAAISFDKGCYLGQELAARIDSRGRVNRTLRGLEVRTNLLPPEGADVWKDERKVGKITSVAESLELMAPVGLSLIRRGTDPGDEVRIRWQGGEALARVRVLPMVPG
ncbi:MAG: hypothetical protein OXS33_12010 [bacterium]|nr:hypothetical protein [bacterium]MDE0500287.1 hypothetical protein [bacterium]